MWKKICANGRKVLLKTQKWPGTKGQAAEIKQKDGFVRTAKFMLIRELDAIFPLCFLMPPYFREVLLVDKLSKTRIQINNPTFHPPYFRVAGLSLRSASGHRACSKIPRCPAALDQGF